MHFSVVREHRDFFRKNHWLECEGVLSQDELGRAAQSISQALAKRLGVTDSVRTPADQVFAAGRDLRRETPALKKIVCSHFLGEIAGELIERKPLRLGYDMLLPAPFADFLATGSYEEFIGKTPTLIEMSGIQGVLCGAMLCISGPSAEVETHGLFSTVPGSAVYFKPDWPLPLHELRARKGHLYLLIVYVDPKAVYCRQEQDPHLHEFKRLGYQFGDRLTDTLNPIVYT